MKPLSHWISLTNDLKKCSEYSITKGKKPGKKQYALFYSIL